MALEGHVSTEQAAAMLGVSEQTVRRLFDDGELSGYRTRGHRGWRWVSVASIEAYQRKQRGEDAG